MQSKAALIHDLIANNKIYILTMQETWLPSDIHPAIKCDTAPPGCTVEHVYWPSAAVVQAEVVTSASCSEIIIRLSQLPCACSRLPSSCSSLFIRQLPHRHCYSTSINLFFATNVCFLRRILNATRERCRWELGQADHLWWFQLSRHRRTHQWKAGWRAGSLAHNSTPYHLLLPGRFPNYSPLYHLKPQFLTIYLHLYSNHPTSYSLIW